MQQQLNLHRMFDVLGVAAPSFRGPRAADELTEWKEGVLKPAWREAVKRTHPDHGGSVESFQEVQEAYGVLSQIRIMERRPEPEPELELESETGGYEVPPDAFDPFEDSAFGDSAWWRTAKRPKTAQRTAQRPKAPPPPPPPPPTNLERLEPLVRHRIGTSSAMDMQRLPDGTVKVQIHDPEIARTLLVEMLRTMGSATDPVQAPAQVAAVPQPEEVALQPAAQTFRRILRDGGPQRVGHATGRPHRSGFIVIKGGGRG